jgi:hypothetical protein
MEGLGRPAEVRRRHLDLAEMTLPALRRVYDYWNAKKGGRLAPARRDIDPVDLREVLSRTALFDIARDPWVFRYRLAGTDTGLIHGTELTGRSIDTLRPAAFVELLRDDLIALATTGRPQFVRIEFTNQQGAPRGYHVLRLPLASDGATVDMVLIVTDYGADRQGLTEIFRQSTG